MFPYLAMIGLPAVLSMTGERRFQLGLFLFAVFLLFAGLIGLRYEIGPDWFSYRQMIESYQDEPFAYLAERGEVGWIVLVKAANAIGIGMPLVVLLGGAVFSIGLFAVARVTQEPMLAVVASTPYLALAVAMSGIRQSIALGIIFIVIAGWHRSKPIVKVILTGAASLFHFSAIIMLMFIAADTKLSGARKIGIGALVMLLVGYSLNTQTFRVDRYSNAYVLGENVVDAPGAILHVALIAAPALVYFLIRKRWNEVYEPSPVLDLFALASLASLATVGFAPAATDRMSLYFSPAAMIIQAGLPMTRDGRGQQYLWRSGLIALNLAAMLLFLFEGNHARAFLPYQSIFSQDAQLGVNRK